MLGRRTKIVATLGPATDPPGRARPARRGRRRLRAPELLARHARRPAPARRRRCARRPSAPGGRSGCCSTSRGRSCGCRPTPRRARWQPGEAVVFCGSGALEPPERRAASTSPTSPRWSPSARRSSSATACRGFAVERVADGEVVAARAVARAAVRAQGRQRHLRAPGAAGDHREGRRRPRARGRARRRLRRALVRALGRRPRAAARAARRARLGRARDRQDREGRGLRAARRDPRRRPTGSWSRAATTASRRASRACR